MKYYFSDTELKKLLSQMVVLVDTREQENDHITDYFDKKKIAYKAKKLDYADYSFMLPACPELGIIRDIYFTDTVAIERKASLEELSGNLTQDRSRFESELLRANTCKVYLMVEDGAGLENIINHRYKTDFKPKSFWATLKTYEARYGISVQFIPARYAGFFIYHSLYYHCREFLKKGVTA